MRCYRIFILLIIAVLFLPLTFAEHRLVGKATYYSNKAHGHLTSDGSIYHKDSFTCAHRTFPFGTILKVRNLTNDRVVYVKVNDRGPFSHAIIDLSYAAAKELHMISAGVSRVEISKVIDTDRVPYQGNSKTEIPQFSVPDPDSENGYVLLSEWAERRRNHEIEKVMPSKRDMEDEYPILVYDTVHDWEVFHKLCADQKATKPNKKFKYILK